MANEIQSFAWNYCPICGDSLGPQFDGERHQPHCERCGRFYYRNPVPAVCCFVTRNGELLLGQRGVDPCRGEWALPGGFMELGETTEEAVARELYEETGLEAEGLRLVGVSTQQNPINGAVTVLGYAVESWRGHPKPGSDVTDLRFFPVAERPLLPFRAHRELTALFDASLEKTENPIDAR